MSIPAKKKPARGGVPEFIYESGNRVSHGDEPHLLAQRACILMPGNQCAASQLVGLMVPNLRRPGDWLDEFVPHSSCRMAGASRDRNGRALVDSFPDSALE